MVNSPNAKLLRIFIGEDDKYEQLPLYETIVFEARKQGLSGATVSRGIMGFGANSKKIHSTKLFEISSDLPLVIEIVDTEQKIRDLNSLGINLNLFMRSVMVLKFENIFWDKEQNQITQVNTKNLSIAKNIQNILKKY